MRETAKGQDDDDVKHTEVSGILSGDSTCQSNMLGDMIQVHFPEEIQAKPSNPSLFTSGYSSSPLSAVLFPVGSLAYEQMQSKNTEWKILAH